MTSRLALYAHAARNTVGRRLGASWAYTDAQRSVARVIFATWMTVPGCTTTIAAGWVADADREVSLIPTLVGDRGEARGIAQWHGARRASILKATNIDVETASVGDQARACIWECTSAPYYKRVWPLLLAAANDDAEINRIIIADFEQSAAHDKDLARQLPMARYWIGQLAPAATAGNLS